MNLTTIEKTLGFELRDFQRDAIERLDRGNNLIVSAPTGRGKTAIYLGASIALEGVTVIVYPLVSLIRDQERRFRERGFEFASFYGQITGKRKSRNLDAVSEGKARIVMTTPESLNDNTKLHRAINDAGGCSLMVIDEAHVFEDWSNSFRPQYRQLGKTVNRIGAERVMMCSATITPESALDGAGVIGRWDFDVISLPAVRENLTYLPAPMTEVPRQLASFITDYYYEPPGIIYFMTVYRLNQVMDQVDERLGRKVLRYHGQMSGGARNKSQRTWTEADDRWVGATKAFGMGIDKADVRNIVHVELPASIVDYAQETGRAGRDGLDSFCWLNSADGGSSAEYLTMGNYPSVRQIRSVFEYISDACPDDGFHAMPASRVARGLGWDGKGSIAVVRTCRGWLSGSGLLAGRKASMDYVVEVYGGATERCSAQEARLINALHRAGRVEDYSDGAFRVTATRDHLASVCEPLYASWQNKLRQFAKAGLMLYQSPDNSSQVRVLNREFQFDAERLIRTKTRAKERLDQIRAFNRLPSEQRPGAIERAVGLEAERVIEELERVRKEKGAEESKPKKRKKKRPRSSKDKANRVREAREILAAIDPACVGWVDKAEQIARDRAALFCIHTEGDEEYGFYIVWSSCSKARVREQFPGYPVYTFVEANQICTLSNEERGVIHQMMAAFDGDFVRVIENVGVTA